MTVRIDMNGKIFTDIIRKDEVPALIQTSTHLIHGNLFIRPENRIKDEFNQEKDMFVAITNAEVFGVNGQVLYRSEFLTINKTYIIWIRPDEATDNPPTDAAA
jgi:hypothetical protein